MRVIFSFGNEVDQGEACDTDEVQDKQSFSFMELNKTLTLDEKIKKMEGIDAIISLDRKYLARLKT